MNSKFYLNFKVDLTRFQPLMLLKPAVSRRVRRINHLSLRIWIQCSEKLDVEIDNNV